MKVFKLSYRSSHGAGLVSLVAKLVYLRYRLMRVIYLYMELRWYRDKSSLEFYSKGLFFMRLVGKRVIIRDLTFKDFDEFYSFGSNPNIGPNAGWKPFPNQDIARKVLSGYILNKNVFSIASLEDNKFMGTISIYEECLRKYKYARSIGFSLDEQYWGLGLMVEAVNLVIDYLFNKTKCEIIEVGQHTDNYQSTRVIEKCGFNYD